MLPAMEPRSWAGVSDNFDHVSPTFTGESGNNDTVDCMSRRSLTMLEGPLFNKSAEVGASAPPMVFMKSSSPSTDSIFPLPSVRNLILAPEMCFNIGPIGSDGLSVAGGCLESKLEMVCPLCFRLKYVSNNST